MGYSRAIKLGVDLETGQIYDADELFKEIKSAFEVRKLFHEDKISLHCCECYQELDVSTSKYDRLHFKHQKKSNPCSLKDSNLSVLEMEISKNIYKAKESERHIELKNKIAQKLLKVKGVNPDTMAIDNKFIIIDNEKRKPDVYCEYHGKKLVFEIQLSQLSLRYILSRYNFYKKNGMYLIWILDNFDVRHGQGQLERDIKYLTEYQNFFKLDEDAEEFRLICDYKFPFLTETNTLLTKWLTKSVSINQIKFSIKYYQIYYFNFGQNLESIEEEQKKKEIEIERAEQRRLIKEREKQRKEQEEQRKRKIELEKAEQERQEIEREENAKFKVEQVIDKIRDKKENGAFTYKDVEGEIQNFDFFEREILNQKLGLKGKLIEGKPVLNLWFRKAKEKHRDFLCFILQCKSIKLSIQDADNEGVTCLMELYKNKNVSKSFLVTELFKRRYKLTNSDLIFFNNLTDDKTENEKLVLKFKYFDKLKDKNLIHSIDYRVLSMLYMIESAKEKRFIGTKLNSWVAFANNAIQYYPDFWEYIELAFRKFSLLDEIIKADWKGSFQKKLSNFHENYPEQNYAIDEIIRELYPEIYEE